MATVRVVAESLAGDVHQGLRRANAHPAPARRKAAL